MFCFKTIENHWQYNSQISLYKYSVIHFSLVAVLNVLEYHEAALILLLIINICNTLCQIT